MCQNLLNPSPGTCIWGGRETRKREKPGIKQMVLGAQEENVCVCVGGSWAGEQDLFLQID